MSHRTYQTLSFYPKELYYPDLMIGYFRHPKGHRLSSRAHSARDPAGARVGPARASMTPDSPSPVVALRHGQQCGCHNGRRQISFASAVQKLDTSVAKALAYLPGFHQKFQEDVKDILEYAERSQLDSLWRKKIETIEQDRRKPQINPDHPRNQIDFPDLLELRHELIDRCQDMCYAIVPRFCEKNIAEEDKRQSAESFLRTIDSSSMDLLPALDTMHSSSAGVGKVIRELRIIKQALEVYQKGWDVSMPQQE